MDDHEKQRILTVLTTIGAEWTDISAVGHGCANLMVSYHNRWHILDLEPDHAKMPFRRDWRERQQAPVASIKSEDDALAALGVIRWRG